MTKKSFIYVITLILILFCIIGAVILRSRDTSTITTFYAMDTIMSVTASGKNAKNTVQKVKQAIIRLDTELSVSNPESLVYKMNNTGMTQRNADIDYLLKRSLEAKDLTDGAFDICIYPLMEEWGFTDKNYHVPDKEVLDELCAKLATSKIDVNESDDTVSLSQDTRIDFGGIAKGYASKVACDIMHEEGIQSALLNLGGNVCAVGGKPDNTPWSVAVKSPDKSSDYLCILKIKDKCVITSGGYERYFKENGKTYHHILNPKTGYPAESGLISVTIISDDPTLADALSTALFVMGREKAIALWRENTDLFDFVLYDTNNRLYVSEGIKNVFSSELDCEFVEK